MTSTFFSSVRLALQDWYHELRISLCAVFALASIIAPLLVLHGIHSGVITSLKDRLLSDPAVLVIMPEGSKGSGYSEQFIADIQNHNSVAFAIGRTRDVASEVQLVSPSKKFLTVTLEATATGDPILSRAQLATPSSDPSKPEIALTASAARKLNIVKGDTVQTQLIRRNSIGKIQRQDIKLTVTGIIPTASMGSDTGFVPLSTLLAIQDYRDNIEVPEFGFSGINPIPQKRFFESFRIYAKSLEDVEALNNWFNLKAISVKTRAREIANLRKMDTAFSTIVLVIAMTAAIGFIAFILSSTTASVQNKQKTLGLLRLMGFSRFALQCYPMSQSLCTAVCGCLLSILLYFGTAQCINTLFSEQTDGIGICSIPWINFPFIIAFVLLLTALSSLQASRKASEIEPSEVIRQL